MLQQFLINIINFPHVFYSLDLILRGLSLYEMVIEKETYVIDIKKIKHNYYLELQQRGIQLQQYGQKESSLKEARL